MLRPAFLRIGMRALRPHQSSNPPGGLGRTNAASRPVHALQPISWPEQQEDEDLFDKMVMIPREFLNRPPPRPPFCWWCCQPIEGTRFTLKDGPVSYNFCNDAHAKLWLDHRYVPATSLLCKTCPGDRAPLFFGLGCTMEDAIEALLAKEKDLKNS